MQKNLKILRNNINAKIYIKKVLIFYPYLSEFIQKHGYTQFLNNLCIKSGLHHFCKILAYYILKPRGLANIMFT